MINATQRDLSRLAKTLIPEDPPAAEAVSSIEQALVEPLTPRELEVLQLMAQGLTNQTIADQLTVVVGTVKTHTNNIYGKLGVGNCAQAVARARQLNHLT